MSAVDTQSSTASPRGEFGPYIEHPVAALFPLMRDTDEAGYSALIHGIRDEGLIDPIVLDGDMIIDGRNRFLACAEAKVAPRFVQYADLGLTTPAFEFAFQRNYVRRQMTDDQRAAVLAGYLAFDEDSVKAQKAAAGKAGAAHGKEGGRGHKKPHVTESSQGVSAPKRAKTTRAKVAEGAHVSEHKAQLALNVQTRGTDELKTAVRTGKVTLAKAQAQLPPASKATLSDAGAHVGLEGLGQAEDTPPSSSRAPCGGPKPKRANAKLAVKHVKYIVTEILAKLEPTGAARALRADEAATITKLFTAIDEWKDAFTQHMPTFEDEPLAATTGGGSDEPEAGQAGTGTSPPARLH